MCSCRWTTGPGWPRNSTADFLISIHADALDAKRLGIKSVQEVRGGTIYTLSETASDEQARILAMNENKADLKAGVGNERALAPAITAEINNILSDLESRGKQNRSLALGPLPDRAYEREDEIQYQAAKERQLAGVKGSGRSGGTDRAWLSEQLRGREIAHLTGMARGDSVGVCRRGERFHVGPAGSDTLVSGVRHCVR